MRKRGTTFCKIVDPASMKSKACKNKAYFTVQVGFGVAHLPPGTQLRRQLLIQHAACLNKETAIDRFVRYPHVSVGRELLLQPAGDLRRRPLQRELLRHAPS